MNGIDRVFKRIIVVMMLAAILVSAVWCRDAEAITGSISLYGLSSEADLVILGHIKKRNMIFKKVKGPDGKLLPSIETEGSILRVSVKEVISARKPEWKAKEDILIYQKEFTISSALLKEGSTYLLFLKEAPMDTHFAEKYSLPHDGYFDVLYGRQGQRDSSDKVTLEAARKIIYVTELKDKAQQIEELKKFLKSENPVLRENAGEALRKQGISINNE